MKIILPVLFVIVIFLIVFGIPVIIFLKDTKKLYENPKETMVLQFMKNYENKGFIVHQKVNERMEAVWNIVNASPYVTLKTKKGFKAFLIKKDIPLSKQSQKIINNFGNFKNN